MLLAIFVLMCVIGALFLFPVILILVMFLLNKNSVIRSGFGEDFRTIFSKLMQDVQNRAQNEAPTGTRESLSRREALEILGLGSTADREQIVAAYHRLMKHSHPDRGGSAYFAQKLNQARDKLLGGK